MKKALFLLSLFALISLFSYRYGQKLAHDNSYIPSLYASTQKQIAEPVHITIPKMNISQSIEKVGEAKDGAMDIPKNENNVGWWEKGARPGEVGSAVMAGHVDRSTGGPGIFYQLGQLEKGDEVVVRDAEGKERRFAVIDVKTFSEEDFPMDYVFATKDARRLNLITCSGFFNQKKQSYSERTVVFTKEIGLDPNMFFSLISYMLE